MDTYWTADPYSLRSQVSSGNKLFEQIRNRIHFSTRPFVVDSLSPKPLQHLLLLFVTNRSQETKPRLSRSPLPIVDLRLVFDNFGRAKGGQLRQSGLGGGPGNTGFEMSSRSDEDILRDDPDLAGMFTDDEDDTIDNDDDDDFGDDFKGFNFSRSGSQRKTGWVFINYKFVIQYQCWWHRGSIDGITQLHRVRITA